MIRRVGRKKKRRRRWRKGEAEAKEKFWIRDQMC